MSLDINGYAIANNAGLAFGASGTKVVAPNHGIFDPILPGMLGSVTDALATYKVYPYPVNSVNLNIGSPWSTSTFRFTAPVAGIYYISFSGITGDGTITGGAAYYAVIINGVNTYFTYRDSNSLWTLHHSEVMINLAAGDTVAWAMNFAPGPASAAAAGAYRSNHNVNTIWLVG
jgi:hypothetical protein